MTGQTLILAQVEVDEGVGHPCYHDRGIACIYSHRQQKVGRIVKKDIASELYVSTPDVPILEIPQRSPRESDRREDISKLEAKIATVRLGDADLQATDSMSPPYTEDCT